MEDALRLFQNYMFLSTPPSRVATFQQIVLGMQISVSIHATLAGGDCAVRAAPGRTKRVSIHATLAGGDDCFALKQWEIYVSIHATLAGGDAGKEYDKENPAMFLSTPRSRVATRPLFVVQPPHTAFLSTPPSRVATTDPHVVSCKNFVSIHATLAGGDNTHRHPPGQRSCFYPRHPRGWRLLDFRLHAVPLAFLSTPPSRVATDRRRPVLADAQQFLSTPPSRVATACPSPAWTG